MRDDQDDVWIAGRRSWHRSMRVAVVLAMVSLGGVLLSVRAFQRAATHEDKVWAVIAGGVGGLVLLPVLLFLVFSPLFARRAPRVDFRHRHIRAPERFSSLPVVVPFEEIASLELSVEIVKMRAGDGHAEGAQFLLRIRDVRDMQYQLSAGNDYPFLFEAWGIAKRIGVALVDQCGPSGIGSVFWPGAEAKSSELIAFGFSPVASRPPMSTVQLSCRVDRRSKIWWALGVFASVGVVLLLPIESESWRNIGRYFVGGILALAIPFLLWEARFHGTTRITIGPDWVEVRHPIALRKPRPFPTAEVVAVRILKLPYTTKDPRTFVDLLGRHRLLQRIELPEGEAIEVGMQVAAILGLLADPQYVDDPHDRKFRRKGRHGT